MNYKYELVGLFKGKSFELLTTFLDSPTTEFSTKEVKKETKTAKATLAKWLPYLVEKNFLQIKKIGKTKLYKLKRENVIIMYLKILMNLYRLQCLKKLGGIHNCEIFLYGSAARGEDVEESDFDLLVIGDKKKIVSDIKKYEEKIKKKFNIQFFNKQDWALMERRDKAFYERVEKDKIKIN